MYKQWLITRSAADEIAYKNYKRVYNKIAKEAESLPRFAMHSAAFVIVMSVVCLSSIGGNERALWPNGAR